MQDMQHGVVKMCAGFEVVLGLTGDKKNFVSQDSMDKGFFDYLFASAKRASSIPMQIAKMYLGDANPYPCQGGRQDTRDIPAKGMGMYDIRMVFFEESSHFENTQGAPFPLQRHKMCVHPQFLKFFPVNALTFISDNMDFIMVQKQGKKGSESSLDAADIQVVGDAEDYRSHCIEFYPNLVSELLLERSLWPIFGRQR
jgi:hypothetical protein